jgi:cyclohexanecarboxylate-CoA ligase
MKLRATYRAPAAATYRRPDGPWDVPTLDTLLSGQRARPGAVVVDGGHRLDPAALESAVATAAGGLRRRGVRRGMVVGWQLPNWWEAIVLFRACWRLGAVAGPIHHQAGREEVRHMLAVLEPAVALAAPGLPLAEHADVLAVRGSDDRFAELADGPPVALGFGGSRPADLAAVIFTSGTTGRPKAVLHTQRGLATKARTMAAVHGLDDRDAVLIPAPLAHISGLLNAVLVPGAAAMRTVLMERFDPERGLAFIETEAVSFMIGPPTMFSALMDVTGFSRRRVATLRVVSSGTMGVSPEFIQVASDALGAIVKRSYGSTEAPTVSTCTNDDPPERCRDTDGRHVGEAELRIVDPVTHRRRPDGAVGEVWIRGPELFAGYADAADTAAAVHRGWFRSGDLGVLEQGWLRITGRIKDLIIRAGENVSAAEVEQALERHSGIAQAVVVGVADPHLGEKVAAFLVGAPGVDVAECRRWFAELGVARFKTPEIVVPIDAVPLLPAGKPDRTALKARANTLAGLQ